ncbi:MAG: hypothetical protein V1932_08185 [Chloroflexota bacterium]
MKKMLRLTTFLVLVMTVMGLAGCAVADKDIVSQTGAVKLINLEGGFYGIVGDDGKNYDPANLSQEFRVDGLRVSFEAKILKDVATTRMWGTPVEIIKIERCKT